MKILFVVTRTDIVGGSQVHVRDLASALVDRGHEVLVAGGGDGPFADDLAHRGVPFRTLLHLVRPIRPVRDVRAVLELRTLLRQERPDLISLHTAKAGAIGRLAAGGSGIPVLYTPHGWPFAEGVAEREAARYRFVERNLAPLAHRIVDVCGAERTLALRYRVGRPGQHVVVHNGMPDHAGAASATPDVQPPRLVMVARFEEQKDHDTLFAALARLREVPWHLDLVGEGSRRAHFEEHVRALGLGERVRFHGALPDVTKILSQGQIFLLASRWEGFPRSILEAMRAGLPVIASDVGGVREAIADGENGFVVPRGDADALTAALDASISDPALRSRMGAQGRRRFEERFTFERMFHDTLAVYEDLSGRGR